MAELRIDGYIGQESGLANLLGDGTSFCLSRLENFLDANTETALKIKINSGGGSVTEGFAIHDRIVSSGLEVETEVLGMCGSIATIIALSAPKGKRKGHANSEYFIHNPFWQPMSPDPMEATDLHRLARELKDAEEKILDFYVDKTGAPKAQLKRLMDEKASMSMEQAKRLGFIDEIVTEEVKDKKYAVLAFVDTKKITMSVTKFTAEDKTWFEKQFASLSEKFKNILVIPVIKNMMVKLKDGSEVFVESEDGEFVGKKVFQSDKTTPAKDGEHTLDDGRTLVVKDGVITEVKDVKAAVPVNTELEKQVAALTEKLTAAEKKANDLEAEKTATVTASDILKTQLEAEKKEKVVKETALTDLKKEFDVIQNRVLGLQPDATVQTFKGGDAPKVEIVTDRKINAAELLKYRESINKK